MSLEPTIILRNCSMAIVNRAGTNRSNIVKLCKLNIDNAIFPSRYFIFHLEMTVKHTKAFNDDDVPYINELECGIVQ